MSSTTTNLGLNTWLETDVFDVDELNENFETIDDLVSVIESGTATANYTGGTSGVATWRYKKYSDGTIDMSTKLEFTNIKCNGGASSPYYSGNSEVLFPFSMSSVYDVQMSLASNTIGWVSNITGQSVNNKVQFRLLAKELETQNLYKQVFINLKGVLA